MERNSCAICGAVVASFYKRENFPMCFYHTTDPSNTDIFHDQLIGECTLCGSIQQMHLFDANILYKNAHNQTFNTPTWKQHHSEFFDFITANSTAQKILDIGGNPDIYAEKMTGKDYKILNICPPENKTYAHLYEIGNCESYTFEPETDILMSHLFEHLYEPRKFVENLRRCNTGKIFISIPNMDHILETNAPFVLHSEHTYFVNTPLIQYMFAMCGYRCADFKEFKNHSYFYCFERVCMEEQRAPRLHIRDKFLRGVEVVNNSIMAQREKHYDFIAPGAHFAQYANYYLNGKVARILDNDVSKHRRLYGTNLCGFSYSELANYDRPLNILVYGGVYSMEIYEQIRAILPDAEIDVI